MRGWDDKQVDVSSYMSRQVALRAIETAKSVQQDSDRSARLTAQECLACWYVHRKGVFMKGFFKKECVTCGVEMTFSSSRTNVMCHECAKKSGLCTCCGGHLAIDGLP